MGSSLIGQRRKGTCQSSNAAHWLGLRAVNHCLKPSDNFSTSLPPSLTPCFLPSHLHSFSTSLLPSLTPCLLLHLPSFSTSIFPSLSSHFLLLLQLLLSFWSSLFPHQCEGWTGSSNGTSFLQVFLPQEVLWVGMTWKQKYWLLGVLWVLQSQYCVYVCAYPVEQSEVVPVLHTSPQDGCTDYCRHTWSSIQPSIHQHSNINQ